jgi:hypothetical protein
MRVKHCNVGQDSRAVDHDSRGWENTEKTGRTMSLINRVLTSEKAISSKMRRLATATPAFTHLKPARSRINDGHLHFRDLFPIIYEIKTPSSHRLLEVCRDECMLVPGSKLVPVPSPDLTPGEILCGESVHGPRVFVRERLCTCR